jgi:hypothetical protein
MPTPLECTVGAHCSPINNLSISYHKYCSSVYLDYRRLLTSPAQAAKEIKLKLDIKKASNAAVAIATSYGLCRVSEHSEHPQLAAANAIVVIIVIAILYGARTAPTRALPLS